MNHKPVGWRFAAAGLCLAMMLFCGRSAVAHEVGLSRGEYVLAGASVTAQLTFAQREMIGLVPEMDQNHDNALSATEVEQARAALTGAVIQRILVTAEGRRCGGNFSSAEPTEADGVVIRGTYVCEGTPSKAEVDVALLEDLAMGHRHLVRSGGGTSLRDTLLYRKKRVFELQVQAEQTRPDGSETSPTATPQESPTGMLGLFGMGIEHILFGYDHLVFLLGLVVIGGKWRSLLLVVTAFTIAHSVTLGLSVLDVWAPSADLVEPAIAVSIAYVGAENFFVENAEKRWRITFPFGLIHGFGFAGALKEIGLPRHDVPLALVSFNLGVEAGQLAVLGVVLPLLMVMRKRKWLDRKATLVVSGAIVVAGVTWFVVRVAGL